MVTGNHHQVTIQYNNYVQPYGAHFAQPCSETMKGHIV